MTLDTMLALALLAGTASAAPADDYAMQWPLTLADRDAGAHAVVLDDEVYAQARSPALRDLDVLNAHSAAVPAQLMRTGGGGRAEAPRVPAVCRIRVARPYRRSTGPWATSICCTRPNGTTVLSCTQRPERTWSSSSSSR